MSSSNYRKWDESQSPQWKYLLQKESAKKKQARRNASPARIRGKQDYDSALQEAKKIKEEKKARNEEITKLLREEKERNTVYR
tara:strand:- start:436 stop:684 length:249 start_codon:yes stop_codon:yes gene_type:complete